MMRKSILILCGLLVAGLAGAQVMDGSEFNTDENGLAIEGYDPVAYFTLGEATRGKTGITSTYNGVTFQFALESHKILFDRNPEQYLPAYGGWCAWAAAKGNLADIDPQAFVVHDERLFLNFNSRLNRRFSNNLGNYIQMADENWPDLSEEAANR